MLKLIKRLLCKHEHLAFVRNLYGDQIIHAGCRRSEWECRDCGAWVFKSQLHDEPAAQAERDQAKHKDTP